MTAPADGRGGSPPPRPAAPESTPGQWFVFGPWVYDVDAATKTRCIASDAIQPFISWATRHKITRGLAVKSRPVTRPGGLPRRQRASPSAAYLPE